MVLYNNFNGVSRASVGKAIIISQLSELLAGRKVPGRWLAQIGN